MSLLKLDLGCGTKCVEGFEGVDIAPLSGVKHVVDLLSFPWPWQDGSVGEIHCSNLIEHIPPGFWTPRRAQPSGPGLQVTYGDATKSRVGTLSVFQQDHRSLDLLLKFFDEAHRVLVPGGKMVVECPQASNNRAFMDPTHRRYLVPESFFFLSAKQRASMGLEHGPYGVSCDFEFKIRATFSADTPKEIEVLMRTEAGRKVVMTRDRSQRNVTEDLVVELTKAVARDAALDSSASAPAEVSDLDAQIAAANARLDALETAKANASSQAAEFARTDHEVRDDGEEPHLFRVTPLPGGFRVDQGNMFLPGMTKPEAPVIVRLEGPSEDELAGDPLGRRRSGGGA